MPSYQIVSAHDVDPMLEAALGGAGFVACAGRATHQAPDLLVHDLRGAGAGALPGAVHAGGSAALLLCDADQAMAWRTLATGFSHVLVAPFSGAALELQLRLLNVRSSSIADDPVDLHQQIRQFAQGREGQLHTMLIGLRRMSAINSTFGSSVGDIALAKVENRLARNAARLSGSAALTLRLSGGDFFVAHVMPQERIGWQVVAEQLLRMISEPVEISGHRLRLTARAALAVLKDDEDPLSLLDRLSAGLTVARESAAEPVRWADRQSDNAPQSGYRLEQDIVRAVEHGEIAVLFQPQFSVATGAITGAEALARWHHPQHGEIGAGPLFAIAEKADFTRQLSRHIRRVALDQAAHWTGDLSSLRLSVNVTAEDLAERGYAQSELTMIGASGFAPNRLTLEITESALVPDLKRAAARFAALRAAGVRIAVDDFGTGYSSLLYLKSLPLDYLKLDHAMTRDIGGAEADRIIVRSIIAMARALSLKVIAEGVESEAQLEALREEGCDYFQGFLRGKAMEAEAFVRFARAAIAG